MRNVHRILSSYFSTHRRKRKLRLHSFGSVCYSLYFLAEIFFMVTRLYLVRHGQTTADKGCFVGSSDLPLSGHGLARLESVSNRLAQVKSWYCSPMIRCRQTLKALEKLGCAGGSVVEDERLREIDFGRWEMKTFAEIAARDTRVVDGWVEYHGFSFPEGESVADFVARVESILDDLQNSKQHRIAVITHGGVIRTMICLALGLSPRDYLLFDVAPASLTILDLYDQGAILKGLNL
ncbi:MAG: hypothetical protein DSY70_01880 [Desulfobulbus sp.]|nr:MAG: hypothetical protein DSY70_01880 [Desulfobulbus sp.]